MITTEAELAQCLRSLDSQAPLCLDTEFMRVRTYYPTLALLQITTGDEVFLIDPLQVTELVPLWQRLSGPQLKVLHACGEDLDVLPKPLLPLFDTQIAAALAGWGMSLGYAALVEKHHGVTLDKGQSRTDWLQRPLTPAQQQYCVNDVLYLPALHQELAERLDALGRRSWLDEECQRQVQSRGRVPESASAYLDIKNAWQLKPQALAVLRELAAWRLAEAQRRNLALNFVVREEHLWAIAKQQSSRSADIRAVLAPAEWRHHGEQLRTLVEKALAQPESQWPEAIERLIDQPDYKRRLAEAKDKIASVASRVALPEAFIGSKKLINEWYRYQFMLTEQQRAASPLPVLQSGWRLALLGSL